MTRPGDLWYRCSSYWHKALDREPGRKRHYISLKKVHRLVAEHLRRFEENPQLLTTIAASDLPDDSHQREKDILLEQMDELTRRRKRWMDAYEDGAIDLADFSQRIGAIGSEEAALATRLERLEDAIAAAQDRQDWLAFVQEALPQLIVPLTRDLTPTEADQLRATFSKLFKRITLTGDSLDFEWRWA